MNAPKLSVSLLAAVVVVAVGILPLAHAPAGEPAAQQQQAAPGQQLAVLVGLWRAA